MKRPAAVKTVMKRPASQAIKKRPSATSLLRRPSKAHDWVDIFGIEKQKAKVRRERSRLPIVVRNVLEKLDGLEQIFDDGQQRNLDLRPHVQELEQLCIAARGHLGEHHCLQVLQCAVGLAQTNCDEDEYGLFLGGPLLDEIFSSHAPVNLNCIDKRSGRSVLLRKCIGDEDQSGVLINWDAICLLVANPRFACLDVVDGIGGDIHIRSRACLKEDALLSLIQRNREHPDPKVRATVNWMGKKCGGCSFLQLVCGARCDHLTQKEYNLFGEFMAKRRNDESAPNDCADIMTFLTNLPVIDHFQGSPLVVKALLEHPDFALVNYEQSGASALHILLSTSGESVGSPHSASSQSHANIGYHSFRHLSWDAKLEAVTIFLDYAAGHPGEIAFTRRYGTHREHKKLLPAELARQVGFPIDLVHRLESLTLPGVPSELVSRVGRCILEFI